MFKHLRFLTLLLVLYYFIVHASASDLSVVVYAKDGTSTAYSVSMHPKVLFGLDYVLLKTDDTQIKYPIAKMRKIVFEEPASMDILPKSQIGYTIYDNHIIVDGLNTGNRVMLYNTAGLLCASFIAGSDGHIDISLDTLPTNIYIVKAGDVTIKVQKK